MNENNRFYYLRTEEAFYIFDSSGGLPSKCIDCFDTFDLHDNCVRSKTMPCMCEVCTEYKSMFFECPLDNDGMDDWSQKKGL